MYRYCKLSFVHGVLFSQFSYQLLIRGILYLRENIFVPYFMCKILASDTFASFYSHEKIFLANIAKIKRSRIKDSLQYIHYILKHFYCVTVGSYTHCLTLNVNYIYY